MLILLSPVAGIEAVQTSIDDAELAPVRAHSSDVNVPSGWIVILATPKSLSLITASVSRINNREAFDLLRPRCSRPC